MGLGVIGDDLLVGTDGGLFVSEGGDPWASAGQFGEGEVFVASRLGLAIVRWTSPSGSQTARLDSLEGFEPSLDGSQLGTGIAVGPDGVAYMIDAASTELWRLPPDGSPEEIQVAGEGPRDPIAISYYEPNHVVVGALVDGLWKVDLSDPSWTRIAPTPTRAVLFDSSNRLLVGTPGGLMIGDENALGFTELTAPIEALAEADGAFFSITSERVVFRSPDGISDWRPR